MFDMKKWAENEIRIACERERGNVPENEWNYGVACYESALKAFNSLLEDEHSGMSISMTLGILNSLVKGEVLTPIEDTDDIWFDGERLGNNGYTTYQCKRMTSLFKQVYDDGHVEYSDVNRVTAVYKDNPNVSWSNGHVSKIVSEYYPLKMPYVPEHYIAVCEEHLTDRKNGDFDTLAILFVHNKKGLRKDIYRYFKHCDKPGWEEIDTNEWTERVRAHQIREEGE